MTPWGQARSGVIGLKSFLCQAQAEKGALLHVPYNPFRILRSLRSTLRVLVRGDFLCEALEVLAGESHDRGEAEPPKLLLEEFWSSEEYFFHDTEQLNLVSQVGRRRISKA